MAIKKYKWPKAKNYRDFHRAERYKMYLSEVKNIGEQLRAKSISQSRYEYLLDGIMFRYKEFR